MREGSATEMQKKGGNSAHLASGHPLSGHPAAFHGQPPDSEHEQGLGSRGREARLAGKNGNASRSVLVLPCVEPDREDERSF